MNNIDTNVENKIIRPRMRGIIEVHSLHEEGNINVDIDDDDNDDLVNVYSLELLATTKAVK